MLSTQYATINSELAQKQKIMENTLSSTHNANLETEMKLKQEIQEMRNRDKEMKA